MNRSTKRTTDLSAKKRALLQALMQKEGIAAASEPAMPRRATSDPVPLSFAQQRLWFLDRFDAGSSAYTILSAVQLNGLLDVVALHTALNMIVQRHEALRTVFVEQADQPVQVIAPSLSIALPLVDLHALPADTRLAEARRLALLEARQPFDLHHGPLLRARILRLDATEHLLVLALHHIVADGWSMGVFFAELATCYTAATTGQKATLPELPIQYADYALWQREQIQGATLDAQLAYWRDQLAGAPPVLELPTDRPRPARQSTNGGRYDLLLPQRLADALTALSRQEGATLFMTLLAAWQTLLYRYSGQDDIVVGSPIAGRTQHETKHLIGLFVNTLVLRTQLGGNPTFRQLLGRVREVCLGAYAHQDLPFEHLVEALQPQRDPSHTPIFQVLFVLQNIPAEAAEMAGVQIQRFVVDTRTSAFDLSLMLEETTDGLKSTLIYNTDLFDSATIERLALHWETLLAGIAAAPDLRIAALPLLSMAERQQIVLDWNATAVNYPLEQGLHQLIEAQVERTPDAVALICEDQELSYAELNRRANQLADHLQSLGVQPEARVGICVERSIELVVGLLGILKAGAAYVPLDPSYPVKRIQWMLHDSQAPVLLTQQRLVANLPAHTARVVLIDADWPSIARHATANPALALAADQLAYVLYTSGSTGQPKGTMNTHRALVNHMLWMAEAFPLTGDDRVLQKTPISFDASVWEFYAPLVAGAQLVLARPGGHQDPAYLIQTIQRKQITVLQLVPTLLRMLLDEPGFAVCQSLRRVFCGGETLPRVWADECAAYLPEVEVFNLYGPTEAAIDTTVGVWSAEQRGSVPIGRPIANVQVYILDAQMQPVPVGVPGEIYIGGVGLGRGYLDRPALTASTFVPDPFTNTPGARLYRTSDLARYLADGQIDYLGRLDHQVKLRGFRIELGEIETRLLAYPGMQDAIVMARQDAPPVNGHSDVRLVAYVVREQTNKRTTEQRSKRTREETGDSLLVSSELRAFLKERLPDFMVPSAFVLLPALPLLPTGKVDRGALPAPQWDAAADSNSFVAPRNELEEVLAEIWAELLPVKRIGIHDSFFDLGGHSLLATRLVSRLRETFQVEVALRTLFEAPTIAQLNDLIEALLIEQLQALSEDEVKRLASESGN